MTTGVNRRDFLKAGTVVTTARFLAGGTPTYLLGETQAEPERPRSANDQVHLALPEQRHAVRRFRHHLVDDALDGGHALPIVRVRLHQQMLARTVLDEAHLAGAHRIRGKAVAQLATGQKGKRLIMTAAHWGTFKLTDEPMDEPPARMREQWRAAGRDGSDLWILRHGETRAVG